MISLLQLTAQERLITGKVTDSKNVALIGVNVIVKGTSTGTVTDFDGLYEIVAKETDVLVFSYIGYVSKEIKIGNVNAISVSLEEDTSRLDEVVVVGYGIKRKSASVGYSITSVRSESVTESLSGRVAGVSIRGVDSGKEHDTYSDPQSGQLTAGEINDIEEWNEWLVASRTKEHKKVQDDWGFYLEKKIEILVKNDEDNPVNNIEVSLYNDMNEKIMSARTDVTGKVTLFKDFNKICKDDYFIVQVLFDNKVLGKKLTNSHKNVSFIINTKNSSNDIDVMFTIDATGSMGDEINYLKSEIKNIISRLDNKIDKKRVALTFYRDNEDEYVVRDFDFNDDIEVVKENLSNQSAGGGGDYEEAVEQALKVSLSKTWNNDAKTRLMFLLLDAPPHLTQENVSTIKKQIKIAQEKGIKIIPIVASGADKTVEFLMRFFSLSTNGTYVFLTDDSGIGNHHLKPTATDYKIEKLNDLIVRLIEKYAGVIG